MIEVVVFDAYGTLFDVYSVSVLAEHLYPGQGTAISTLWRDKQIEYTRLISLSDPNEITGSRYYQSFWELTKLSLQYTLTRLKLDVDVGKQNQLMDQYAKLTPFAETLGVLTQLKLRGIPTAILSNGSPEMLASAVQSAGITDMLQHVISVDQVKQFKTSLEATPLFSNTSMFNQRKFCLSLAMLGMRWELPGLDLRPFG